MKKRSISLCNLTGMAVGLIVAAGVVTQSSANVVMALTFDEGPQLNTAPKPFTTADVSGSGNPGFIQDDGAQPLFGGDAFSAGGGPQIPNFELSDGTGNGPAGPFGPGSSGSYFNLYVNHIDLTPAGTPGQTPNNDLTFTDDFTVEFWFRTGENAFNLFQLNQANSVVGVIGFFLNSNGTIEMKLNSDTTEYGGLSSVGVAYNDNQWHHLAGVRDATAGTATMYIDGGAANGGQTVPFGAVGGADTFSEPWSFAHRVNGWGDNGRKSIWQIDDLRISTTARTEAELGFHAPIPEPASLALLLIGAGLLSAVRRRK